MKAKELRQNLKVLEEEIITDEEKLDGFVKAWTKGFYQYSFYNTLLVMFQRPEASVIAGFRKWNREGRKIKKGERALWILAPAFKKVVDEETEEEEKFLKYFMSVPVFDISQTEGKEVVFGCPEMVKGNLKFKDISDKFGEYKIGVKKEMGTKNGETDKKGKIWVAAKENETAMIATLIHEIAHNRLKGKDESEGRSAEEVEVESISNIVCKAIGIENERSKYYIANWNGDREQLKKSANKIVKISEGITRQILNGEGEK